MSADRHRVSDAASAEAAYFTVLIDAAVNRGRKAFQPITFVVAATERDIPHFCTRLFSLSEQPLS